MQGNVHLVYTIYTNTCFPSPISASIHRRVYVYLASYMRTMGDARALTLDPQTWSL